MARFYKTASATPLDYMYKLNVPLMERTIKANDAFVNQNLAASAQLETLGTTFPYGIDDEQRAKEIAAGYSGKANAIVDAIRADPVNWRKQRDPIRGLSRELQADFKTGEISKIGQTQAEFKKAFDAIDEMGKEYAKSGKGLAANEVMAFKSDMLKKYRAAAAARGKVGTGYDPTTGEYTSTAGSLYTPMANIDIRKAIGDEMAKIKADANKYRKDLVTGQEWYFDEQQRSWKGVTPERLLTIAAARLQDPQYQSYLKQRQDVGLMQNVFDEEGKFIAPYSYGDVKVSAKEQQNIEAMKGAMAKEKRPAQKAALKAQLEQYESDLKERSQVNWSDKSSLTPMIQGLIAQHAWKETDDFDKLRANPAGAAKMNEAGRNRRQGLQIASNERIAAGREGGLAARHADKMKLDWATHVRLGGVMPDTPLEDSSTTRIATNSFRGIKTTDKNTGGEVDKFSVAGMSSDIDKHKKEITDMSNALKTIDYQQKSLLGNRRKADLLPAELATYNTLEVQKQQLQREIPKVQGQLDTERGYYKDVDEKVLANDPLSMTQGDKPLTPRQIEIYNEFKGNTKLQEFALTLKSEGAFSGASSYPGAYMNPAGQSTAERLMTGSPEMLANKEKYSEILQVINEVNKRRDNVFNTIKSQTISSNAVNLGREDSRIIGSAIFNNPQGISITDNRGLPTDIDEMEGKGVSWFKGKKDNYNMTLKEGGGTNLIKYLNDHPDVTYTARAVGTTTGIGKGGAVVEMTFNDPNGEIPKSPFYFELSPEVQQTVSNRLVHNKDLNVQQIGKNLGDAEANDIRRQLAIPNIYREAGSEGLNDGITHRITIHEGQTDIPLQVTRYTHNGEEFLNIQMTTVDGGLKPLGAPPKGKPQDPKSLPPSGMPGVFRDGEDFIQYLREQRARVQK